MKPKVCFVFLYVLHAAAAKNNGLPNALQMRKASMIEQINPSGNQLAPGQFELGQTAAERAAQGIFGVDSSEESNSILAPVVGWSGERKQICQNMHFLSPNIIMHSSYFWNWFDSIPDSVTCDRTSMDTYNLHSCKGTSHSTVVILLARGYLFMACVHDEASNFVMSGIVHSHDWSIKPYAGIESGSTFFRNWTYEVGMKWYIDHRFDYDAATGTKPFCWLTRLNDDSHTPLTDGATVACWCKGDFCPYVLFDYGGFNPGPFMRLEKHVKISLSAGGSNGGMLPQNWEMIAIISLCFVMLMLVLIPLCVRGGRERASRRLASSCEIQSIAESTEDEDPLRYCRKNVKFIEVRDEIDVESSSGGPKPRSISKYQGESPRINKETGSNRSLAP